MRPRIRDFHAYARYEANEAIWSAQLITWLPVVVKLIAGVVILIAAIGGGIEIRRGPHANVWMVTLGVIFDCLYALAGWWIGARQARGIWLAIALFIWSLGAMVLHGHLLTFGALYNVLALSLIVRAGRAIGVRYLAATAR